MSGFRAIRWPKPAIVWWQLEPDLGLIVVVCAMLALYTCA